MNILDPVISLMNFNKRVLAQGTIQDLSSVKNVNDLKDQLFFNSVFLSNMDEMFQKYNMSDHEEKYEQLIRRYVQNVNFLISRYTEITGECINHGQSVLQPWEMEILGKDLPIQQFDIKDIHRYHGNKFKEGIIYHLVTDGNTGSVYYIDPNDPIFEKLLQWNSKNCKWYCKIDALIRQLLFYKIKKFATTIRVVKNRKTHEITKIEYSGHCKALNIMKSIFRDGTLMVYNPYLYTKDIDLIFDTHYVEYFREFQYNQPVLFKDVFNEDIMIEYPQNSFAEHLNFLKDAAQSKQVSEIKVTLYRIGNDPSIINILKDAVKNGIQVHANIELHATGESINKQWAKELIEAGVHVTTYSDTTQYVVKVHCKLTLIKFKDGRSICQIGTGNYHTKTTSQYTDLSYLTSNKTICKEADKVFRLLDGEKVEFNNDDFLVTRGNAYHTLMNLIMREAEKGPDGYISIKCNAVHDPNMSEFLQYAADKGCMIDLVVRGMCTWFPKQIDGQVRISSIIWNKLEHSRVYAFGRINPTIYIGSLDLVWNKLEERIETLVRLKDPDMVVKAAMYMNRYLANTKDSWVMSKAGIYYKERGMIMYE